MRRKRLKHCADTLCHMFCGWRLANSYADIEMLGSGTLEINALTGEVTFNGEPTKALAIAGELHHWLAKDCIANDIALSELCSATVVVQLELRKIDWKQRKTADRWFDQKGKEIVRRRINQCVIDCRAIIETDDYAYRSRQIDVVEWPEGFPGDE